ncbi:hypothetical protein [Nocardia farcinica]|uniref:hypothetical protein n=1 Tax=Nocardia farcinica TaxID=37329 RepID=UPI002453A226|nr:hypothetical protein [Nocardia farcinica]
MLLSLGKADVERRSFLRAGYSAAVSASVLNTGRTGSPVPDSLVAAGTRHVGRADVTAVHDVIALFSRIDQRHGGGHGRSAEHAAAQRYFVAATKLATEADDAPLTGHILRAMAHQAIDLGDPRSGLALAEASVDGSRSRGACPRERALLTVVHAKALSAAGRPRESAKALLRAERDLAAACGSDAEPARVFFFSEASLAHETACALRDSGDLDGAAAQFQLSARKRQADMLPAPTPSPSAIWARCRHAAATSTSPAQHGPPRSTPWAACDPDAPVPSPATSARCSNLIVTSRICGRSTTGPRSAWPRVQPRTGTA